MHKFHVFHFVYFFPFPLTPQLSVRKFFATRHHRTTTRTTTIQGWRNTSTKKTREFAPKFSHALPIETKFSSVGFLDPFIQDVAHLHTNCQLLPLYLVSMCLSLRREILKQAHLPSLSSPKWKINFTIVF